MVDLAQVVDATDADGTAIRNKDQKTPTLGEVGRFALSAGHQRDANLDFAAKNKRYLLLKRWDAALKAESEKKEIELTAEDVTLVKERIGMLYLQVGIIGRAAELLDGQP